MTAPDAADIDRVVADGYLLIARSRLTLLDAEIARLRPPPGISLAQARSRILQLIPAATFDLNHLYRPGSLSCDRAGCEAFSMIGWKASGAPCPAGITVGMIDTAVDLRHPALAGADIDAFSSLADERRPAAAAHGTAVAALLAGHPASPTPGLLRGVRLMAASAFHRDARGNAAADAYDLARALDTLATRGVAIVNMSFAGPRNAVFGRVVEAAGRRGLILVAAAGNGGPRSPPLYPAAYPGVIAVTAVDRRSRPYRAATRGPHIDFAAPGVRLWTAGTQRPGYRSGTSYAVPFVTAAFAVARARAPARSSDDLFAELAESAQDLGAPGRDDVYGWGLIRADGACTADAS